jgi:hypothetical protein
MEDLILSAELVANLLYSFECDSLLILPVFSFEDESLSKESGTKATRANDSKDIVIGNSGHCFEL